MGQIMSSFISDKSSLLTLLSAPFTTTPSSSPLFSVLTLPAVFQSSSNISRKVAALGVGSTVGSIIANWNVLPRYGTGVQGILSLLIASYVGLIVKIHRVGVERWIGDDDWVSSPIFGLVWAAMWSIWSRVSPLGRYGVPAPELSDLSRRLIRYLGVTGLDFVVGMTGHAVSQNYKQLQLGSSQESTPLSLGHQDYGAAHAATSSDIHDDIQSRMSSPSPSSSSNHDDSNLTADNHKASKFSGHRKLLAGLTSLLGLASRLPPASTHSLSEPIQQITPLSIGCAIPTAPRPELEDVILTLRQFGNRAQLLLMPETALSLRYEGERTYALDLIQRDVCEQYGAHVMVSLESPGFGSSKDVNEVVLVGPHGVLGSYVKESLFPCQSILVEDHRYHKGKTAPPIWSLNLTHPHGITKPEWSIVAPFTRLVDFSPLICLDTLHPGLIAGILPNFLAVAATSRRDLAKQVIHHAQTLSAALRIPSVICSSGVSAAVDENGDIVHEQVGGKGFIARMAIPWSRDGAIKPEGVAQKMGSVWVLGSLAALIAAAKAAEAYQSKGIKEANESMRNGASQLTDRAGRSVKQLLIGWTDPAINVFPGWRDLLSSGVDEESQLGIGLEPIEPQQAPTQPLVRL